MKQKIFFLLVMMNVCLLSITAQNSSGIIAGGGIGLMDTRFKNFVSANKLSSVYEGEYNYDLYIGYRYRLKPSGQFLFYDLDARFGTLSITESAYQGKQGNLIKEKEVRNNQQYYFAIGTMANIKIYKGLNFGIGFEPTYYFHHQHRNKVSPRFDIPVVAKIGYDFGSFELALSGKYGLVRNSLDDVLKSNRRSAFMLSVYIPIFK